MAQPSRPPRRIGSFGASSRDGLRRYKRVIMRQPTPLLITQTHPTPSPTMGRFFPAVLVVVLTNTLSPTLPTRARQDDVAVPLHPDNVDLRAVRRLVRHLNPYVPSSGRFSRSYLMLCPRSHPSRSGHSLPTLVADLHGRVLRSGRDRRLVRASVVKHRYHPQAAVPNPVRCAPPSYCASC